MPDTWNCPDCGVREKVDFKPVGPSRGLAFSVAPDHQRAYGLFSDIGEYEFWTFDLEKNVVEKRTRFDGRPIEVQVEESLPDFIDGVQRTGAGAASASTTGRTPP